jgi:hypothetical protein
MDFPKVVITFRVMTVTLHGLASTYGFAAICVHAQMQRRNYRSFAFGTSVT